MKKGKIWAWGYGAALTGFTAWLALDTFVIPHVYEAVPQAPAVIATAEAEAVTTATPVQSATSSKNTRTQKRTPGKTTRQSTGSATVQQTAEDAAFPMTYDNGQTQITLNSYRINDTTVYVADVTLSSADALASVLAQNAYGRNVTETPSSMAQRTDAILAVNGDYYGARERGYVIRNGVLYRSAASKGQEDLVIDGSGNFSIIREEEISAEQLLANGAAQVYSFGPALLDAGEVTVDPNSEVGRAMSSNPRTALAQVDELHYLFVVADGRTDASAGLSLYELAQFLQSMGAETAYNLDGGGSSAMIFGGRLINTPTTTGNRSSERSVSDIVGIF